MILLCRWRNKLIVKEQIHFLGKLLKGQISISNSTTVVFKSAAMALFDLIVAKQIYELALARNIGTKIID